MPHIPIRLLILINRKLRFFVFPANPAINRFSGSMIKMTKLSTLSVFVKKFSTANNPNGSIIALSVKKIMFGTMILLREFNTILVFYMKKTKIAYLLIKINVFYAKKAFF